MKRMPAVAGQFYPAERQRLAAEVAGYLTGGTHDCPALGMVVPHAGYMFSGAIAAEGYRQVEIPAKAILLGPNHSGVGAAAAVYASGSWQTPLGDTPIAETLAADLINSCDLLENDPAAHQFEHSLEVQLPFLQILRPDIQIVPITLGYAAAKDWLELGRQLGQALKQQRERVLLIASSDMNHFASAAVSQQRDQLAIQQMEALEPLSLYQTVRAHNISMCGVIAAVVMLEATRQLGAQSCRLLRYGHSGEVNGDLQSVVGYASLLVE